MYAAEKNPQYFPSTLKDDTLKEELIYSNKPNDLKFDRIILINTGDIDKKLARNLVSNKLEQMIFDTNR